jgi:hypothetical protein
MGIHEFLPAAKRVKPEHVRHRNGVSELSRKSPRGNELDKKEWHGILITAH